MLLGNRVRGGAGTRRQSPLRKAWQTPGPPNRLFGRWFYYCVLFKAKLETAAVLRIHWKKTTVEDELAKSIQLPHAEGGCNPRM